MAPWSLDAPELTFRRLELEANIREQMRQDLPIVLELCVGAPKCDVVDIADLRSQKAWSSLNFWAASCVHFAAEAIS